MKKKLFLTLLILAFTVSAFGYSGHGPWDSPNNVAITGGTIDGTVIGGTTPAAGTFTDLYSTQTFRMTQGTDVASANAMTLGDGNFFDITGTTTINTIASKGIGTQVALQFDGILQLTHSNDLFLPTAANITTAAGDVATCYEYAAADWRCDYMRADGTPLAESATKANVALDNLASVAINTALIPGIAGTIDAGTEALYLRKGYFGTGFSLEGATDNAFQLTLALVDPTTPDKTITFPDLTGTVGLSTNHLGFFSATSSSEFFGVISDETGGSGVVVGGTSPTFTTSILASASGATDVGSEAFNFGTGFFKTFLSFEGPTDNDFQLTFAIVDPTTPDKTITFQDATGTVVLDGTAVTELEGSGLAITTGTLNWTADINDLGDVVITSAVVDEHLGFDGTNWVNLPDSAVTGGSGVHFYMDDSAIIATGANNDNEVNTLTKEPAGGAEDVDSISVVSNTVLKEAYLYNTALGSTSIEAGQWVFDTYASVSATTGGRVSSITRNIYHVVVDASTVTTTGTGTSRTATAAGGTPFVSGDANATESLAGFVQTPQGLYQITAFSSGTVVTITTPSGYTNESGAAFNTWKYKFGITTGTITSLTTSYLLYETQSIQAAITIVATDKLGEIVFGVSNNTTTVNYTHNGTDHYSHFTSPLLTRHNDLAGLQGGSSDQYYHSTSAEYTGSGTGNFVRVTGATLSDLDLSDITNSNLPYMAAGGFVDSPLTTNGTDVDNTGASTATSYTADAVEDPVNFYDSLDADDTDVYTGMNCDAGASADDVFEIRTSSTPGTNVIMSFDYTLGSAKVRTSGDSPGLSSCGSSPTITGSDSNGKVTIGTGATQSCTVTFDSTFTAAPACVIAGDNNGIGYAATTSATVLTITSSADMASDVISYICMGIL